MTHLLRRVNGVLLAAAVALAASGAAAASAGAGKVPTYPAKCPANKNTYPTTNNCLLDDPDITVTVSPRIVTWGQTITLTVTSSYPGWKDSYIQGYTHVLPISQYPADWAPSLVPVGACGQSSTTSGCPEVNGRSTWRLKVTPSTAWRSTSQGLPGWVDVVAGVGPLPADPGLGVSGAGLFVQARTANHTK